MLILNKDFYNLIKYSLYFGATIKNYPNSKWDCNFQTKVNYYTNILKIVPRYIKNLLKFKKAINIQKCSKVYELLADEYSKTMYIKVLMYWFFNDSRIRFPQEYELDLTNFWDKYNYLLIDDTQIEVPNGTLKKYDLKPINKNFRIIFGNSLAFYIAFIKEQYNYRNYILPKQNDIVIDGGACYGDSALFFIDKMKGLGEIYAFEFVDKNLEILENNLELNPHYKDSIHIVKHAISDQKEDLYVKYNASASVCSKENTNYGQKVTSISIDEFVHQYNLKKIDFIKLDIEGYEQKAIQGAKETINKFKPKLAICLYHNKEDLWEIPLMIDKIVPGYKFYLDHYTLNTEETVLYGVYCNE